MKSSNNPAIDFFIASIESYYGAYSDKNDMKSYVKNYLEKYDPKKIKILVLKVYETHSRHRGVPDISAINKANVEHMKEKNGSLKKTNSNQEWVS